MGRCTYRLILCTFMLDYLSRIMGSARTRFAHKHFRLDSRKIKRAQKLLRTETETETIERALDLAIAEHERNASVIAANERFITSGIEIKDVFGKLEE